MQKTSFEKYLSESFDKVYEYEGRAMEPQEVMKVFFPEKIASFSTDLNIQEDRKNAIILVGPSCCGKTTFAKKFVKEHEGFVLVSMDECAVKDMEEMSRYEIFLMAFGLENVSTDDLGNQKFGQMLEAGHKNIIIDGSWMHVNSRGALLRALDDMGYHTILLLILPNSEDYKRKVDSRVMELIAAEKLDKKITCVLDGFDLIKAYADKLGCTVEEVKQLMRLSDEYMELFMRENIMLDNEIKQANFESQIPTGIILLGADELIQMDI